MKDFHGAFGSLGEKRKAPPGSVTHSLRLHQNRLCEYLIQPELDGSVSPKAMVYKKQDFYFSQSQAALRNCSAYIAGDQIGTSDFN